MLLQLDYKRFDFTLPDALAMTGTGGILYFALLGATLGILALVSPRGAVVAGAAISFSLFIVFPLVQRPSILGWDTFLHTTTTLILERTTRLGGSDYLQYPGAFYILGSIHLLSGLSVILTAQVVAASLMVVDGILIFLCGRTLAGTSGGVIAIGVFALTNFRFADYYQYSPQAVGVILFLVAIYVLFSRLRALNKIGVNALLLSTIILVHPFTALLLLITVATFVVLSYAAPRLNLDFLTPRRRAFSWRMAMFAFIIFAGWHQFVATSWGVGRIEVFTRVFSPEGLQLRYFIGAAATGNRGARNELLNTYRLVMLVGSIALTAATVYYFRRRETIRTTASLLFAMGIFAVAIIALSKPPTQVFIDRVILLGTIPVALVIAYGASNVLRRINPGRRHALAACALVALMLPMMFYTTQQYVHMSAMKPEELEATRFLAAQNDSSVLDSDGITLLLVTFYAVRDHDTTIRYFELSRFITTPEEASHPEELQHANYFMRSFRQEVNWYYVQGARPQEWSHLDAALDQRGRLYDNGDQVLYRTSERLTIPFQPPATVTL